MLRSTIGAIVFVIGSVVPAAAQAPLYSGFSRLATFEEAEAVLDEARALFGTWEETGDPEPARRARELLRRLEVEESQRADHALALAAVLARGPESRLRSGPHPNDWFVDFNGLASAHSLRLLRGVLDEDATHRGAALELARWAIERDHPPVAAEAEIALAGIEPDADVLLARAHLNLLFEHFDSAAALADRARSAGADAGIAGYVRAYALLQEPETRAAGVEAYYAGARTPTRASRFLLERSAGGILDQAELEALRATPDEGIARHLRRLWERRAAIAGVTHEERLAEHFRRLHRSRIDHPSHRPLHVSEMLASYGTGVDARVFGLSVAGMMMVRHGDPHLLDGLLACLSNPRLMVTECAGAATRQRTMRIAASEGFNPFRQQLPLGGGVYAFRGLAGATDLLFAATLPTRTANALVDGSGMMHVVFSAVLIPDSGDVIRSDTAFRAPLPDRFDPMSGLTDAIALLHHALPLASADTSFLWRLTISDPSRYAGSIVGGRFDVPALDGFSLSSIAVAPADAALTLSRGAVAFAAAPYLVYATGQPIGLYYEVYGLGVDARYRTEIELQPHREGLAGRVRGLFDGAIRLSFEGRVAASDARFGVQESRSIVLDDVEPGVWRMRITVTDLASGRSAARETLIEVGPPAAE